MLIADSFGCGRVFLVGRERAREPAVGRPRLQHHVGDAVNIAWKIAAVLQGWAAAATAGQLRPRAPRRGRADRSERGRRPDPLAGDLAAGRGRDPAAQAAEFYSLGLVLGYTYAGSPVVQPSAAPAAVTDTTTATRRQRSRARGCRTAGCPTARRSTTALATASPCSPRPGDADRGGSPAREARPATAHPADRPPRRRPPTRGATSSCWSGPTSTLPGGPADPYDIDIETAVGHRVDAPRHPQSATA